MSIQSWEECLSAANVDGVAISNTTTATSLLGGSGTGASHAKFTIPANFLYIGKVLKVHAQGRISTVVTTPGTLTLDIRFGNPPGTNIIVATGSAMTLSTTAKTNVSWWLEWVLTCRAVGSGTAANFMHMGQFTSEAAGATTVAGEAKTILCPTSAPAVGTGFDSTISQQIDLFATWSIANASNSILLHQFKVEALN